MSPVPPVAQELMFASWGFVTGRGLIGSSEVVPSLRQGCLEQLGDIRLSFFCQIVPETHVLGILDYILNDPFPEVIREEHPIYLSLSISFPKCISLWFPDKDEIALFGRQHHLIPINHKHMARSITDQISCMQICMTDDVWHCASFDQLCQFFQGGHCCMNRGVMLQP